MSEAQTVVAVRLRYNPKAFWFDPVLSTYQMGDHVLVDTDRGREVGLVVDPALELSEKQLKELKGPLKPVIRALSETDYDYIDELDAKGKEAMPVFRELIEKHQLDMKPVSVEYLYSGDKAVFYFSNDERVDFRDLVRDLASSFHIRVDMRQIGVRDEARILGGLAHCGEELCCARMGGEFEPVSIRIAKEQDLPLNPSKISGACGRLMCCLRYEFEAYKDFKTRAPKKGALIETPIGQAKVIDFDTPREIIMMRLEDGKQLAIPLTEFDCTVDESGKKHPCSVSRDAIHRCATSGILMALATLEQELAQSAEAKSSDYDDEDESTELDRTPRRPRRTSRQKAEDDSEKEQVPEQKPQQSQKSQQQQQQRQQQRQSRPLRKPQQSKQPQQSQASQASKQGAGQKKSIDKPSGLTPRRRNIPAGKDKPHPGQHSSGLRGVERTASYGDSDRNADTGANKTTEKRSGEGPRRRLRRTNPPS